MSELKQKYKELLKESFKQQYPKVKKEHADDLINRHIKLIEDCFTNPNGLFEIDLEVDPNPNFRPNARQLEIYKGKNK